ncbi:MAG TPA: VOC family protein [Chloroflexota bacterium]|nr:VOC family protein [Chloroflexota bacterium]
MMVTFTYVTLYVEDLQKVRDWYTDNVGLAASFESASFVMLAGTGGGRIGLHQGTSLPQPERVQLHFEVPDVDALYQRLTEQGVSFKQAPTNASWGYRVATLQDPAGHTVELYTPL